MYTKIAIGALGTMMLAATADSLTKGRLLVSATNTKPTCATAGSAGEACVDGDLETNGALDVAGAATLRAAATVATTLGVTGLTTATGGITTTKPLILLDRLRFCGNGANGTTPWYAGPVTEAEGETDFSIGSAACDGNDSGTEGTADAPIDAYSVIKVVGMACVTEAGGAADTSTYQLRSATADVTGVTCSVTNDGALAKQCSVILAAPVTIALGATLAVKNVQSGTDNMSAKDMGCTVYYTY